MYKVTVVEKLSGEIVSGILWSLKPSSGWLVIVDDDDVEYIVDLKDIKSAVTITRNEENQVTETIDVLEKARRLGWKH